MSDIRPWFSLSTLGHIIYDGPAKTLKAALSHVSATYPYMVELTVNESPLYPSFFEEDKNPWTSFYSVKKKVAIFAFEDVKDAVEFRLKL
jgi:hypothetical protein